jgi:GTP cyclohydrolase I
MDSPPFKPKAAIPSHLTNGPSSPSPLSLSTEARDKKERDSLFAAIQSSNRGRQAVNFDVANHNGYFPKPSSSNTDQRGAQDRHRMIHSEIGVDGYNDDAVARTPLATSRAQSPYTQHPTIDFDGLSWPSKYIQRYGQTAY